MQPTLPNIEPFEIAPDGHPLPDGWKYMPLRDVITQIESGTSVNGEDRKPQSGEIGVLKLSCVRSGRFVPSEQKTVLPSEILRVSAPVQGGTIIMSRKNTIELVGANVYSPTDIKGLYLSDLLWQIRTNTQHVEPKWLAYLLSSTMARKRISAQASGTSHSMKNISKDQVLSLIFMFPPRNEQTHMVDILDVADSSIHATEKLIETKTRYKVALAEQLLNGQRRFPEFSGEWQEVEIGNLFTEIERPVAWDDEEFYNLISIRRRSEGIFFRGETQGKTIKTKTLKTTRANDFLISRMQVVHGAWGRVGDDFDGYHVSDSYTTLVPKSEAQIDVRFFDLLSRTPLLYCLARISSHGVHIEKMTFNLDLFLEKKILIPPTLEEQRKIAEVLGLLDEEIALLRRELEALKRQKQGLMQQLLTGKVRVKEFAR